MPNIYNHLCTFRTKELYSYMTCPYCKSNNLYVLKNSYNKCVRCKKKFSINKILLDKKCIKLFCNNINAHEAAKKINVNYRTVQNRYVYIRKIIAFYLENLYNENVSPKSTYEEYFYIPQRIKNKKDLDYTKSINIIAFYSNERVYSLLLPHISNIELIKFIQKNKINTKNSYMTPLRVFWKYLDKNLIKHKGVNKENFFYYLKEYEFKFNFLQNKQVEILNDIYYI